MYLTEQYQNVLYNRIVCNSVKPRDAVQMVRLLIHWEQHKGIRWVVNRLKEYRQHLLDAERSNLSTKSNGTLRGPFGALSKLSRQNRSGTTKALAICQVYGLFEAKKPTQKEYLKFKVSLIETNHDLEFKVIPNNYEKSLAKKLVRRFDSHYPSKGKLAPVVDFKQKPEWDITPIEHVNSLFHCPSLVRNHYNFFYKLVSMPSKFLFKGDKNFVGVVVGLTKDRGMKTRFISNPFRLIQLALSRLKNVTSLYLKRFCPESAVFDQEEGVSWVIEQFNLGKKISSIDLSNCTDLLPLDGQLLLLRHLFPDLLEDIAIFEEVARSSWKTPYDDVRWETGQPLGTGPSFSVFTLYHVFLVRYMGGNENNFRVIGDDIVISDPSITPRYIKAMDQLKVPISPLKSLFYSNKAEFAGRFIDKYGKLRVFKASIDKPVNDPLGLIRQYGQKAKKLLPKGMQEKLLYVASLPPPYGFGGCSKSDLSKFDSDAFYTLFETTLEEIPSTLDKSKKRTPQFLIEDLFVPQPENWRGYYSQTKLQGPQANPLGYGYGVQQIISANEESIVEHVNANTKDVPLHKVPKVIRDLHEELKKEETSHFHMTVSYPISFIRKLWGKFHPTR